MRSVPSPRTAVAVLDVADLRSFNRTVESILEQQLTPVPVDLADDSGRDLLEILHENSALAEAEQVLFMCAGERLASTHAAELATGRPIYAPPPTTLVPNPFAPSGVRLWRRSETRSWEDRVIAPDASGSDFVVALTGSPAPFRASALRWLRDRTHLREVLRGTTSPSPAESIFDAVCLAWAGEHDAAVARALPHCLEPSLGTSLRVVAARITIGSALAIHRPLEATRAIHAWWEIEHSPVAASWSSLLAALAPEHISSLTPILTWADANSAEYGQWNSAADPWVQRALDAKWGMTARGARQQARLVLAAMTEKHAVETSAEQILSLWRTWRSTSEPMAGLVAAWPESARPVLLTFLENSLRIESPVIWHDFAIAYAQAHGASPKLVQLAAEIADELPLGHVLAWETVKQARRVPGDSLLLRYSASPRTSAAGAVLSAAIAVHAGLGVPATRSLQLALARVSAGEVPEVVRAVHSSVPDVLGQVVAVLGDRLGAGIVQRALSELGVEHVMHG